MTRSIVALLVGTFVLRVGTSASGVLLVFYLTGLNDRGLAAFGPGEIALLHAAFYSTELACSPVLGALADRIGRRPVLLLGPLCGGLAVVLTALTSEFGLLVAARLIAGLSAAASVPAILGAIAAWTAGDQRLRGRTMASFEIATLGGLLAVGPPVGAALFTALGQVALMADAVVFVAALGLFWIARDEPRPRVEVNGPDVRSARGGPAAEVGEGGAAGPGRVSGDRRHYLALFSDRRVLAFAPTWLAINGIIGLIGAQALYLLTGKSTFVDANQVLLSGFAPLAIGAGAAVLAGVAGAGILFWGNAFGRFRRSSILVAGLIAFVIATVLVFAINHSWGFPQPLVAVLGGAFLVSVFVLAGATPAALGLLADVSEVFPHDRSAIMGLYAVLLGVGQLAGTGLSAVVAGWAGFDGILGATGVLSAIALLAMLDLRGIEHHIPRVSHPST